MRYEDLSPKENLYFPKVTPEGNIEHPFLTQITIINFYFFLVDGGGLNLFFPTVMTIFIYLLTKLLYKTN